MRSNFLLVFTLSSLIFILSSLIQHLFNYDKLIHQSLSATLKEDQIMQFFAFQDKWQWVSYAFIPLFLIIKTTLVSNCLYIGAFFFSKAKVTFKQLFNAVVKAEFIFLGVGVFKIVWFYFFQTNYTLEDLQYFYPLSALNIVGYQELEAWFIYPLQVLNLFELAYWFLLSYFIGKLAFTGNDKGKPMDLGFKIVASSYGSALLFWVVVVMFFTLNYS